MHPKIKTNKTLPLDATITLQQERATARRRPRREGRLRVHPGGHWRLSIRSSRREVAAAASGAGNGLLSAAGEPKLP